MATQLCRDRDAQTYRALFDIETYVRLIVRWELRGNGGRAWAGSIDAGVRAQAGARMKQEADDAIIDPLESGLLSYLHLSELKDILLGPLWGKCSKYWRTSLDLIAADFKRLIAVRNKVAHFRPVTEWDIKVVQRFADDLARATRPYRKLREFEVSWRSGSPIDGDVAGILVKRGIPELSRELEKVIVTAGDSFSVAVVGHHVAIRICREAGAISGVRLATLLRAAEKDITAVRIGRFGADVEVLVPIACGTPAIVDSVKGLIGAAGEVVEPVSSDELVSAYGMDRQEAVLPDSVSFPDAFEVPAGAS